MFAKGKTVNILFPLFPSLSLSIILSLSASGSCARFVHASSGNQSKLKGRKRVEQELPLYERNSISSIIAGEKNGSRAQNFGIPLFFLSLFLLSHSPFQTWRPYNTSTNFHLVSLLRLYAKCRANKCNPPTPSLAEGSVDFNKCLFALDPAEARERQRERKR